MKTVTTELIPGPFFKNLKLHYDPLPYYWICRSRNELHKIPLKRFKSIEAEMAAKCEHWNWTALDYFWNRLDGIERARVASAVFTEDAPFPDRLFFTMSQPQQLALLIEMPDVIIWNFFMYSKTTKSALWAWMNSKDFMSDEKFANTVWKIFSTETNCTKDVFIYRTVDEKMSLLMEIWETAFDHHRKYVVETKENEIIQRFKYCLFFENQELWAHREYLRTHPHTYKSTAASY